MKVGIRGMGLIGGSFEKAFLQKGHEVANLKDAPGETIRSCALVIVCLPPLMVADWIKDHAGDFAEGAIITDAAGVKSVVCKALAHLAEGAEWTFIGGHPMAGKERSGYENASAGLFEGASMVLTPYAFTPPQAVERLKRMLGEIGFARFAIADPERHDEMIAYTSQLAHVVSSAYVQDRLAQAHVGFSAGSFQDMTRVATVDPAIWTDLFVSNSKALSEVLTRLIDRLGAFRDAIALCDAPSIGNLLASGRAAKELAK
jgi:prephenate dehydrogenase